MIDVGYMIVYVQQVDYDNEVFDLKCVGFV